MSPNPREAVLIAIGRARRWVDELMAGSTVADIAKQQGKGERQVRLLMRLAFLPPQTVRRLAGGNSGVSTITDLASDVPLLWPATSRAEFPLVRI